MKEQSVLDLFMIARVCHYDTENKEQGVKKLWIWTAAPAGTPFFAFQTKLFFKFLNTLNMSLDLKLYLDMLRGVIIICIQCLHYHNLNNACWQGFVKNVTQHFFSFSAI